MTGFPDEIDSLAFARSFNQARIGNSGILRTTAHLVG